MVVLGRGRLGTSLARALGARLVPGRTWREGAPFAAQSLVLLAVPDPALAGLTRALVGAAGPGAAYAHTSGAMGLGVMRPLADAGHEVGSLHPLQSFPAPRPPSAFQGSTFAIEASSARLERWLMTLATTLGGVPRLVPGEHRTLYHAAAVLASNYLVVLAAQATSVLVSLGWPRDEALAALVPLMRGMVANLEDMGLPAALIGPIRRGDPQTVQRHLEALQHLSRGGLPLPLDTYRTLGLGALELAREAGLEAGQAGQIAEALGVHGVE